MLISSLIFALSNRHRSLLVQAGSRRGDLPCIKARGASEATVVSTAEAGELLLPRPVSSICGRV